MDPHPEGGFYKQTYRSKEMLPSLDRHCSTAIVYLLRKGERSVFHRIKSDEMWHFYLGGALRLVGIDENGASYEVKIGNNLEAGEKLQHVVPAGHWFAATPAEGSEFSFVGCTVSPGFDFADFEIGSRESLLKLYPAAKNLIDRFT